MATLHPAPTTGSRMIDTLVTPMNLRIAKGVARWTFIRPQSLQPWCQDLILPCRISQIGSRKIEGVNVVTLNRQPYHSIQGADNIVSLRLNTATIRRHRDTITATLGAMIGVQADTLVVRRRPQELRILRHDLGGSHPALRPTIRSGGNPSALRRPLPKSAMMVVGFRAFPSAQTIMMN